MTGLDPALLPLSVVVFGAWTVQAITGFGSTILALTLGAAWLGIPEFLPVTVVLNLPLTVWSTLRHREEVDVGALGRLVLPWMTAGVLVGLVAAPFVGGDVLKRLFGLFVLVFAVKDLVGLYRATAPAPRPPDRVLRAWILGAGLIHGVYGSGGPALVQATSRLGLSPGAFRATMSAVWLFFDVVLIVAFAAGGRFDHAAIVRSIALMPAVPLGVVAGELLHPRLPERQFRGLVQAVLVLGGLSLLR